MASLITNSVVHIREDVSNIINNITPEETPILTMLKRSKATNTRHEFFTEKLNPPNADNARVEGAEHTDTVMTAPDRLGNYTQISSKVINVSGTLQAVSTVGAADEFGRQTAKAGKELKRDIEAALVGNSASNAGGAGVARRSAGMESWIATNVDLGVGGAVGGYTKGAGTVAAPTDGTLRVLTEDMFQGVIQQAWKNGGDVSKVIAGPALKQAISRFDGGATKYTLSKEQEITAGIDVYVSDFGRHDIIPHRIIRDRTVLLFDPSLWAFAVARNFTTEKLGKLADADRVSMLAEWTLECKNELGNAKIADVSAK